MEVRHQGFAEHLWDCCLFCTFASLGIPEGNTVDKLPSARKLGKKGCPATDTPTLLVSQVMPISLIQVNSATQRALPASLRSSSKFLKK